MTRGNFWEKTFCKATFGLTAVLLLGAGAAQAQTTYYNAATTTANPQTNAEGFLQIVNVAGGAGSTYTLGSFVLGVNYADTTQDAGVIVNFYTGVDTGLSSANALLNATNVGGVNGTLTAPTTGNGNYTYTFTLNTPIPLGAGTTFGVEVLLTTSDFGSYATSLLNGRFTASAPTVGTSPGYVWNDANLNGIYTGAEQTRFGQTQANIRLSLTGTVTPVPEPSTYALCATASVGLVGLSLRRRRLAA